MPFIESTDKFQKWRYIISELYILYPDGSNTQIPNERLISIAIDNTYDINLFPVFRIELVLASYTYYKILKYKNNVKFKIRCQKYYTAIDNSEKSLYRDWINDTFDLILDDDDFNSNENLIKQEKEISYDTVTKKDLENDLVQVDNVMEFFLFKSDLIDKLNTHVNAVLSNATVNDGIQYIASQIGLDNLLMSSPHNDKTYKELVIPPLKAKQAIKFLDTYYGLYKTGMMFYCDTVDDITYLLEYSPKCTAYQSGETKETHIIVPEKSNSYSSDLCSLYRRGNKETNFIIGDNTYLSIRNESISFNAYGSTDAIIIDTYSGDIKKTNNNIAVKDKKSLKVIENNTENEWFNDIYNNLINSKNLVIEIPIADYDISAITPNKLFKVIFENSALSIKYKGNFLLISASHSLMREGESFKLTSVLKLKQL